jgi:hypothetical protein
MKQKSTLFFSLVLILILAIGCQSNPAPSPLSASLSELSGKVDTKQAGQEDFTPASADTALEVNGQVQTGDDGRVRLDLSSGTIIRVGPSSFFTLTANDEVEGGLATRLKLDIGKIFIILNGGSADVETPSGVASVRGSYMKVEVDPVTFDIYITCLEGDCSANNPAGAVNFTNGQKVVLFHRDPATGNWTPPNVEDMTPEDFQEWLDENPEAKDLFDQAMATLTAMAQATEPPTEEPTESPTEEPQPQPSPELSQVAPPADASNGCFAIIQPQTGNALPKQGQVTFEWEAQSGASQYLVTFFDQNGRRVTINTSETSTTNYIEFLPAGGSYSWFVTSYGADGNEICSTTASTFSKPQGDPTPKPTRDRSEDEPTLEPEASATTPPTKPPKPTPPPACEGSDYCDPNSSCYDEVYCVECIVEGVDKCEQQSQCNDVNTCEYDEAYYFCYDPGASICGQP